MGAWGTSLYANDSASDIRGDYVDKLRRGKTNEEVTKELIEANQDIMGDLEEEALFWFALAVTQWNYGRLLPEVKEKALFYLTQDKGLERWKESGQKQLNAWKNTLEKLKGKLESPQPPIKKCPNIVFTSANGNWAMYLHIALQAGIVKRKGLKANMSSSEKFRKILGGLGILYPLFKSINGWVMIFLL